VRKVVGDGMMGAAWNLPMLFAPSAVRSTNASPASSGLQGLQFVQSLVDPSGEMDLVPGNLLQGLLIRQEALPIQSAFLPGGELSVSIRQAGEGILAQRVCPLGIPICGIVSGRLWVE
jgi:hypothetical protein